jgi:hypothetical protein
MEMGHNHNKTPAIVQTTTQGKRKLQKEQTKNSL